MRKQISVSLTSKASANLSKMFEDGLSASISQLICDCINTIYTYGLYGDDIQKLMAVQKISAIVGSAPKIGKKLISKEELVSRLGGRVDGNTVRFKKYEMTAVGDVIVSDRIVTLTELPENEEDLRRVFLGPYSTLTEAQNAFKDAN